MKFAENNRISRRQLYRQIVIAFIAPFLLCLFGKRRTLGLSGLAGSGLAVSVLLFYVIFLVRLRHGFANPCKTAGQAGGKLAGLFFLIYCILGAAFLLDLLGEIVAVSLGTGVPRIWLCVTALVVVSIGTHRGIQRRGRIGEVSGGIVLLAVVLMFLLSAGQGKWEYFQEMLWNSFFSGKKILNDGYRIICAFSGIGLLPFALEYVEQSGRRYTGSVGKTVSFAVLTLGLLLLLAQLLFPAVFGWERLKYENYPVLPLLAGADLPGNVLARFDALWMGFLLYSLLFSAGSLLHYGHLIVEKTEIGTGRVWISLLVFTVMVLKAGNVGIRDYFEPYLEVIFVPGMLLIQVIFFVAGRRKWKKKQGKEEKNGTAGWKNTQGNKQNNESPEEDQKSERYQKSHNKVAIASIIIVSTFIFTGCGGVEPEKRMYALALGADFQDGKFELTYGIPDLPKATGQEKNGEDQGNTAPVIRGENFTKIETLYSVTQEKYLDLGHLEVLILGQELLDGNHWEQVLEYLKQEPVIGENVYVFRTASAASAVGWVSPQKTSLGEYLVGVLENNPERNPVRSVTLREVYHEMYSRGALPVLPELEIQGEKLEIK